MKRISCILLSIIFLLAGIIACDGRKEESELTCTLYIECKTALDYEELSADIRDIIPDNGIIIQQSTVSFEDGESVYDVLVRECKKRGIHMEASYTPVYNSAYIEGINNLYEFDCGSLSGWTYCVNSIFPNYGCSNYFLSDGDCIEFHYTCDLGRDVGCVFEE